MGWDLRFLVFEAFVFPNLWASKYKNVDQFFFFLNPRENSEWTKKENYFFLSFKKLSHKFKYFVTYLI